METFPPSLISTWIFLWWLPPNIGDEPGLIKLAYLTQPGELPDSLARTRSKFQAEDPATRTSSFSGQVHFSSTDELFPVKQASRPDSQPPKKKRKIQTGIDGEMGEGRRIFKTSPAVVDGETKAEYERTSAAEPAPLASRKKSLKKRVRDQSKENTRMSKPNTALEQTGLEEPHPPAPNSSSKSSEFVWKLLDKVVLPVPPAADTPPPVGRIAQKRFAESRVLAILNFDGRDRCSKFIDQNESQGVRPILLINPSLRLTPSGRTRAQPSIYLCALAMEPPNLP